ncbi:MAG: hypothetical protein ABI411_10230 [Tahibacter sp.]
MIKNNLIAGIEDYNIAFGLAGDIALGGDWNVDGVSSAGVYRPGNGTFYTSNRNANGPAPTDGTYTFCNAGDIPLTGDWTHSGYSGLGVFRQASNTFVLKYSLDASAPNATAQFDPDLLFRNGFDGMAGDLPVSGIWGPTTE